jgi:hypothetical protein
LVGDHNSFGRNMIVAVEIVVGQLMRDTLPTYGHRLVIMSRRNKGLPSGVTGCHLEVVEIVKEWIGEENRSIPIDFFNERREVGEGNDIAMFGKPSIENFIELCLSLLLYLGIADHRQKKSSKC